MYKHFLDRKKAVFFDLDGTIIDSEELWIRATEKILTLNDMAYVSMEGLPQGVNIEERVSIIFSKYSEIAPKNLNSLNLARDIETEFIKLVRETNLTEKEGFVDLYIDLKMKKQLKTALVTNTNRNVTEAVLDHLKIKHFFDIVICGNEVKKKKPDGEIYKKALKLLKLKPWEALVFEDSLAGATSAYRAGLQMIIIWNAKVNKHKYPEGVKLFTPDFQGLAGSFDTYYEEDIKAYANELIKQKQEQEETTKNTTPVA